MRFVPGRITLSTIRGSNPREASIYATNEVWISVIATTLVIVAVFVSLWIVKRRKFKKNYVYVPATETATPVEEPSAE